MREPTAVTQTTAGQTEARRGSWIGARFAPFFARVQPSNLTKFANRRWPVLVFAFGFLLLSYVGLQYLSMWHEQQVFAEEWTRQVATRSPVPIVVSGDSGVARLTIPKLDLSAIVIEGTSYKALKAGPGHLSQTPLPGDRGNAVLAGHRDTFFRKLDDLAAGDSIVIERGGHTYRFTVTRREIVDPGDLSVLRSSAEPELTLITCYPPHFIGTAPKRLVIIGELATAGESGTQGH